MHDANKQPYKSSEDLETEIRLTPSQIADCIRRDLQGRGITVQGEIRFIVREADNDPRRPVSRGLAAALVKARI